MYATLRRTRAWLPAAAMTLILLPAACSDTDGSRESPSPDEAQRENAVVVDGVDSTVGAGDGAGSAGTGARDDAWGVTRFYIELTEDDIEVQSFVDGARWQGLEIASPAGYTIYATEADSYLGAQGLSELQIDGWPSHFPVVGDPAHLEIESVDEYLALFPAGTYYFHGRRVAGGTLSGEARFTHDLPGLPEILSPPDEDELAVLDPEDAVIRWEPVTETFDGKEPIEIVEYEVIVEQVEPFRKLSIHVPGDRTSLRVPRAFLEQDAVYDVELVAIEASDNQTIAASAFRTSADVEAPEETDPLPGALKAAAFYVELSEDDIEIQTFTDGSRWDLLEIEGPSGDLVLRTEASSFMADQGLSELTVDGWPSHFPIEGDPEHLEIPSIDTFLSAFTEGTYRFRAVTVDGEELTGAATFTHDLPALPVITAPTVGDEPDVLDRDDVTITWQPVTRSFDGEDAVEIVTYEVVVEQVEPFRKLSIHLPASATSVRVPVAFLEAGREYEVEVMAIERSGNQTFAVTEFATAER